MIFSNLKNILKQKPTSPIFYGLKVCMILLVFCISCTSNPHHSHNETLQKIEPLLWQKETKIAREILQKTDTTTLDIDDKKIYLLYNAHLLLLEQGRNYNPEGLDMLTKHFRERKMYKDAGHSSFIQGRVHIMNNEEGEAMLAFKQAEEYAEIDTVRAQRLLCELYYQIARCYRMEKLSLVAYDYCEKVLPYAYQTNNYYLLSETYKLMANIQSDKQSVDSIPQQNIVNLYDSALHYFSLTPNRKQGNFHVISYNRAETIGDTIGMIQHSKYLVDSVHFLPNAIILTNHYLHHHQTDSARHYLTKFAADTLSNRRNTRWSQEQYAYYNAYCLLQEKHPAEAAYSFKALYDNLTRELSETEQMRTYQVSRQYDVEKEQRERLEVEVEKQGLMIVLVLVGATFCVLILVFFIYKTSLQRKQDLLEVQTKLQTQRIAYLDSELQAKHEDLRHELLRRLEFSRRVQLEKMKQSENEPDVMGQLPAWAQAYIQEQLLSDEQTSQKLRDEVNNLYYHVLDNLQKDFPRLTPADMLMIVLIILRIPLADVSLLLAMPKQSIWNRRQFLKERLGIKEDLDNFILKYTRQVIEKSYHQQKVNNT